MNIKKNYFFLFLLLSISSFYAQLDSKHYLPPLKQTAGTGNNATRANNQNTPAISQQAIYLSTPETTAFTVRVYRGTSNTEWAIITNLSNTNPHIINANGNTDADPFTTGGLTNGNNNITLVTNINTGRVLQNSGLRFESDNGEKFYVNYRGRSGSQAGSLTCKGIKALGTDFRWGGIPNRANNGNLSTSLGIMATANDTRVNIFGYDPDCVFRDGTDPDGITADNIEIILQAGETYVLEAQQTEAEANKEGWLGATIRSTKNIAIANGGLNVGLNPTAQSRDVGIDQPVSTNVLGREYVFVRGNGNNLLEFPVIVATENGTEVFANGVSLGFINNGDFMEIPGSNYSGTTVGSNMYVTTSKNTYAYQSLAGAAGNQTGGMNFIAPVNCLLPDSLSEIPQIDQIAGLASNISAITIIASTLTLDSEVEIYQDGVQITTPPSQTVSGTSDWKTFYVPGLSGEISIVTPGPITVGTFMSQGTNAGLAGYFSGFDTVPQVNIDITGGGCFPGSNLREETGGFQLYEWFKDGVSVAGPAPNLQVFDPSTTGTGSYFVMVTKGTCSYPSGVVTLYTCEPDVFVTKVDNVDPIIEGDDVTFTIKVESYGVDPVNNLVINDVVPSAFDVVSATPSPGAGTWTAPNWNVGTINPSQVFTLDIVANAKDDAGGQTVNNVITYTSDAVEPNPNITIDDLEEEVTILGGEIAVSKSGTFNDGGDGTDIGDNIDYTFTVTNPGQLELENVVVNDPLLGGNISGPANGDTDNDGKLDTTETWVYNASYPTTVTNFRDGKVDNTVSVTSELSNGVEKTATDTETVILVAIDLSLIKTVDNALPKVGSLVTYTLKLTNSGPSDATGIEVTDLLPTGLTYSSHVAPGSTTYDSSTGIWDLSTVTLNSNDSIELQITASINGAGTFVNTAQVTKKDQFDIDSD